MATVSIKDAKNRLTELARQVEQGETITITRNGKPIADLVPHQEKAAFDPEKFEALLAAKGLANAIPYVAPDFDEPLAEDFLLHAVPD